MSRARVITATAALFALAALLGAWLLPPEGARSKRATHAIRGAPVASTVPAPPGDPTRAAAPRVEAGRFEREFREAVDEARRSCAGGPTEVACEGDLCVLFGRDADALERFAAYAKQPRRLVESVAWSLGLSVDRIPCAQAHQALFGAPNWSLLRTSGPWQCMLYASDPDALASKEAAARGLALCGQLARGTGAPW